MFTNIGFFSILSTYNAKLFLLRICKWGKSAGRRAQGAGRRAKGAGQRARGAELRVKKRYAVCGVGYGENGAFGPLRAKRSGNNAVQNTERGKIYKK